MSRTDAQIAALIAAHLPVPPASCPDVPTYAFGMQLLAYLLRAQADGRECYGLLSYEELELANHSSQYAVTAPEILPLAVDRISQVRHRIATILRQRDQERNHAAPGMGPADAQAHYQDDDQDGGRLTPLLPQPKPRPPAPAFGQAPGQKVEILF